MKTAIKCCQDLLQFGIEGQNMGLFLVIKYIKNMYLSKYVNNKSLSPIFIFFNEKKFRKIQLIFDIEK